MSSLTKSLPGCFLECLEPRIRSHTSARVGKTLIPARATRGVRSPYSSGNGDYLARSSYLLTSRRGMAAQNGPRFCGRDGTGFRVNDRNGQSGLCEPWRGRGNEKIRSATHAKFGKNLVEMSFHCPRGQ